MPTLQVGIILETDIVYTMEVDVGIHGQVSDGIISAEKLVGSEMPVERAEHVAQNSVVVLLRRRHFLGVAHDPMAELLRKGGEGRGAVEQPLIPLRAGDGIERIEL